MCSQTTPKPGRTRVVMERGCRLCAGKGRALSSWLQLNYVPRPGSGSLGLHGVVSASPRFTRIPHPAAFRVRMLFASSSRRPAKDPQTASSLFNYWREDLRAAGIGSRVQNDRFPHVARLECTTATSAPAVFLLNGHARAQPL